ncbi:baseplate J/gp47 family protein [Rhizobium sp. SSA_523]|uniref:baseplate J/gp47 family protein n=1 Tax=Rhizobium sp. SSA_523 TaxID=2952477 RepID=UPI002091CAC2|nr:baseplate J/gp47 family protein [Rhizobium sp. SSA_523]MCO5734129.1 baseplate J/gp47 family protein [Rhizobium sp. SSA_523]WKC24766.1 baseplate J/gp47 family protein [Rhizobium sp. SSA_523]
MTIAYAPTAIDLSRIPAPEAIEALSATDLLQGFIDRFLSFWAEQRLIDPTLPAFDEQRLQTSPAIVVGRAWTYLRLLDRQRVNDGLRALLAPLATGSNLDVLVARRNIERLVIVPETATEAAVLESDEALLRRYLESFDVPAAGSAGRYLYDARKAWPQSPDKTIGLWDARVNGRAIHKRQGETDLVIIGPFGRLPTVGELATVRAAVTDPARAPEACGITVMSAERVEYQVSLVIEVPGIGPSAEIIKQEAIARVTAAARDRILIGGEIPLGYLAAAAYGNSVIKVRDLAPVAIDPDPYQVPVMTDLTIVAEVR